MKVIGFIKSVGMVIMRCFGSVTMLLVGFTASLVMQSVSYAAAPWIDVSSIAIDTTPVATLGLTILTAIASLWVLKKLIKTGNRS